MLEFFGGSVLAGHNLRFDTSFLDAALLSAGYSRLSPLRVDTCALARRLVRDEMPNCRLSTLASRLRLAHQPSHRALDDALATTDLLHALLERAAGLGVLGLDDLLSLPTLGAHPLAAKLRLTAGLPRRPGVYLFRGGGGRVLYVGKATDLRARLRSYFSGDDRRKVLPLLREAEKIDHVVCEGPLEAAVLEVRLIHRYLPPYNSRSTRWRRYAYLKLTLDERFPRLSVVRKPIPGDGCLYLGPLPSPASARTVAEAIETAVPIRRCTARPGRVPRDGVCTPAQLGVATCPCAGTISEAAYRLLVDQVVRAPHVGPDCPPPTARRADAQPGRGPAVRGGRRHPRPSRRPGAGAPPPTPAPLPAPGRPLGGGRGRSPARVPRRAAGTPGRGRGGRRGRRPRRAARRSRPPPSRRRARVRGQLARGGGVSGTRRSLRGRAGLRAPPPSPLRAPGASSAPEVASASVLAAFVLVQAEPARVADLASELADVEGVAEVYSVGGDEDWSPSSGSAARGAGRRRHPTDRRARGHPLHPHPRRLPRLQPPRPGGDVRPRRRLTRRARRGLDRQPPAVNRPPSPGPARPRPPPAAPAPLLPSLRPPRRPRPPAPRPSPPPARRPPHRRPR